ncbi:hypothetical protein COOFOMLJ_01590 [Aeromonas veronii]
MALTPEQVKHNEEVYKNSKVDTEKLNACRARLAALLEKYKDQPCTYNGGFDF